MTQSTDRIIGYSFWTSNVCVRSGVENAYEYVFLSFCRFLVNKNVRTMWKRSAHGHWSTIRILVIHQSSLFTFTAVAFCAIVAKVQEERTDRVCLTDTYRLIQTSTSEPNQMPFQDAFFLLAIKYCSFHMFDFVLHRFHRSLNHPTCYVYLADGIIKLIRYRAWHTSR